MATGTLERREQVVSGARSFESRFRAALEIVDYKQRVAVLADLGRDATEFLETVLAERDRAAYRANRAVEKASYVELAALTKFSKASAQQMVGKGAELEGESVKEDQRAE